ncbi:hypothetical protein B0H16DRAFT_1727555 [Mycena metata]|uniref:FAD/NAD(P)-binding domain-containing protein n=1 Tax=Mycena metata TaxID=1033252 RepID=A0AAD7IL79_9AGAR|nr:hypothetical protein B0H16DRAFT_1727555 [Mycena metata]
MASSTVALGSALVLLIAGLVGWQRMCKSPPPWQAELDALGQPRAKKLPGTAVVCGGSVAGSVTARILADHFERVILVDPEVDKVDEPKTRIMQYNALHGFLCLFVVGARRLWPNFDAEIQAAGGRLGSAESSLHYSGLPVLYPRSLPDTALITRPCAQRVVQKLSMQHSTAANITFISGTVRGVDPSGDMGSIQSVLVRKTDGTQVSLNDVALVVDCTGPTQSGIKWLKSAGFALPENLRRSYNGNMHYTTIWFEVTPEREARLPIPAVWLDKMAIYANGAHASLGCAIVGLTKSEKNTIQLIFCDSGEGGTNAPRVVSDILPYLQRFPGHAPIPPWFFEVVSILCEQEDPLFYHNFMPTQSYVEYHRVPAHDLPSNFIAIGDATLQLNPIHGQGFAKAMLNGIALDALLRSLDATSLPRDFSAKLFQKNAAYTGGLWDGTRLPDYAYATVQPMEGETNETGRFLRWFGDKLVTAAMQDEEVATAMWTARHLLAAESALLAPTVLWKVLWTSSRF